MWKLVWLFIFFNHIPYFMVRIVLTKHKDEAWGYLENYRGTSNSGSWEERWKLQNVGVNSSKIHLKKM